MSSKMNTQQEFNLGDEDNLKQSSDKYRSFIQNNYKNSNDEESACGNSNSEPLNTKTTFADHNNHFPLIINNNINNYPSITKPGEKHTLSTISANISSVPISKDTTLYIPTTIMKNPIFTDFIYKSLDYTNSKKIPINLNGSLPEENKLKALIPIDVIGLGKNEKSINHLNR